MSLRNLSPSKHPPFCRNEKQSHKHDEDIRTTPTPPTNVRGEQIRSPSSAATTTIDDEAEEGQESGELAIQNTGQILVDWKREKREQRGATRKHTHTRDTK